MLGNGFDLNYKLPTKYINFLNTVHFIGSIPAKLPETVGDIFGSEKLQFQDTGIAESYRAYQSAYDTVAVDEKVINILTEVAKHNIWFSYLLKSFNRDIGWIDFEKEISMVVHSFQSFLQQDTIVFDVEKILKNRIDKHVIYEFDFFYQPAYPEDNHFDTYRIKEDYIVEYPFNSGNRIINKEKIIGYLEGELKVFADALKLYLRSFVENVVDILTEKGTLPKLDVFRYTNQVITLNYTNTFEKIYSTNSVFHIHGNVNDAIVLGINPDSHDEGESLDTSFLGFKKYYQRTIYKTDGGYLRWLVEQQRNQDLLSPDKISLLIMGHSLDVTDKDIVEELFSLSDDITILYYNESAFASLVTNLVGIFGREHFYQLRTQNKLIFLQQDSDFFEYLINREITSKTLLEHQLELMSEQAMTIV